VDLQGVESEFSRIYVSAIGFSRFHVGRNWIVAFLNRAILDFSVFT